MRGRSAATMSVRRKRRRNKTRKNKTKVSGLWSLPDSVVVSCLAHVSRMDLAAVAVTSKSKAYRSLVASSELRNWRRMMDCLEAYIYVCLHIFPEPTPRWFVLHPVQRRLKPIYSKLFPFPESSASFVLSGSVIYMIGGLVNGKPTSDVWLFCCYKHTWYRIPPMKMARASASACRIEGKIYVFGGCGDNADYSKWAEVHDPITRTWDSLFVPRPPKNIQQSVVNYKEELYAVDEDGQFFTFSPKSEPLFVSSGKTDSKPGYRDDWCFFAGFIFCRGTGGRILWCLPDELDWKEVKGLEELQHSLTKGQYDISKMCIKLCRNSTRNLVIFWNAQPQGPESLELWSAEISLGAAKVSKGWQVWGFIEWSGPVYKLDPLTDSYSIKFLSAHDPNA